MVTELSLAVTAGLEGVSRTVSVPLPEPPVLLHPDRNDMITIDTSTVARWRIFPGKIVCFMAHLTFLHKHKKSFRRKDDTSPSGVWPVTVCRKENRSPPGVMLVYLTVMSM
jgi:hypothetical protein